MNGVNGVDRALTTCLAKVVKTFGIDSSSI